MWANRAQPPRLGWLPPPGVTPTVCDGMLTVQERDANNLAMVSYTRGNDLSGTLQGAGGIGGLLARTDNSKLLSPNSSSAHAYYHCDGNGNVTALVDTNGLVVARYQYDPYGNLLGMAGPLAEANPYRFSSKECAGNASLYYYGYRFYEPNLQRWLNRDPIEEDGGFNLYGFVLNDPINYLEPYGLWSEEAHNCLLQHVLKDVLPQKDIDKIKKSSADFDKKTQSPQNSYKHSMRTEGQSVRDAIKARDKFIERKTAEARKALQLLGEALHPVMDAASPEHTSKRGNPKVWNPLRPWGHSPTDWLGNETSKNITPAIYENQDKAIRATCEKVIGK